MSARQPWAAEAMEFLLRTAAPEDAGRVGRFLAAMDREGLYQRHFAHGEAPNQALLQRLAVLDHRHRVAVLAVDRHGEVLGHGEYVAEQGAAEFALMVLPQIRARGIGGRLLHALLDIAVAAGHERLHGMIQASNSRALRLVRQHGFGVVRGDDATVVLVSRNLAPSHDSCPVQADQHHPLPFIRHDPDRTSLHRRPGSRTPFRAGGG